MARLAYAFVWAEDVPATVGFYERAFGLRRKAFVDTGEETGFYAELDTGEVTLAVADEKEARVLFSEGFRANDPSEPPGAFQLSFVWEDVAGTFGAAVEAGANPLQEPREMPWGQTIARVRGPNGVLVSIASPPAR
jgi:lactoylglutathione lyase